MKTILLFTSLTFSSVVFADSINNRFKEVDKNIERVANDVKRIESNQLNYQIEKDLLKETYSNNYESINLVITIVLGVIGVLGYLGLKDLSTVKKEYEQELAKLKTIEGAFNLKSQEFDNNKKKFEDDLKSIIKENEEQSRKIKFIELKDKARTLLKEGSLTSALEFANAALQISGEDLDLLNYKGVILCRLNQMPEAVEVFNSALKADSTHSTTILNAAECLYFAKEIDSAKKLIREHQSVFDNKANDKLVELFNLIELYYEGDREELMAIAKANVEFDDLKVKGKKSAGWDFKESLYFIHYQPDGELKNIIQNILWYWDGQITGETLLTRLDIELPVEANL